MKRRNTLLALFSLISSSVYAGGIKGDIISDEVLIGLITLVLVLLILSFVFSAAYKKKPKLLFLVLGSLFTIPFFLSGVFFLVSLNLVIPALICFVPCVINGMLIGMAKS